MTADHQTLGRASVLAAELIDICRAAGKPLAADFVHAAMEQLAKGTRFETMLDRWPEAAKDRSHEN